MEMYKCDYCKKSYKNKYLLNRHVKTGKTCISFRPVSRTDSSLYTFECVCGYTTHRKDVLLEHRVVCGSKAGNNIEALLRTIDDEKRIIENHKKTIEENKKTIEEDKKMISEQSRTISELKVQIDKLISRPINVTQNNTNNNNTYNGKFYNQYVLDNFEALTPTFLQGVMEQMTLVDISHGGTGLAKFAKKHLHHQHLLMLDQARRKGLYKDANGEAKHDSELRELLTIIGQTAFPPANILFTEWSVANKEDCFLNEEKSGKLTRLLDVVGWLKRVGDGIIHDQDSDTQAQFLGEFVAGFSKEALHNCLERPSEPPLIEEDEPEYIPKDGAEYIPKDGPEDSPKDEQEERHDVDSDSSEWPEVSEVDSDEDSDIETVIEMDIASIASSEFDIDLGILNYETDRNKGVLDGRNYWIEYKSRSKFP
jgi:hypothetical protein